MIVQSLIFGFVKTIVGDLHNSRSKLSHEITKLPSFVKQWEIINVGRHSYTFRIYRVIP